MSLFKGKTNPGTNFNVVASNEYIFSDEYNDFVKAVLSAYEAQSKDFFKGLSDDEVVVLYASSYLHDRYPLTQAYDDEVSEALFGRENADELIGLANKLIFDNLTEEQVQWSFSQHFPKCTEKLSIQQKRDRLIEKLVKSNGKQ